MSTISTGIYHWKLGDIALARVCKKVYAKVQVVKNGDGLFYDDKVLGITADDNGTRVTTQLCYHVETVRYKQQLWVPYTCMHLAERSRPFYGSHINTLVTKPDVTSPGKRKIKEDNVLPLNVTTSNYKGLNLEESLEIKRREIKLKKQKCAFKEFVRLGKEYLFDDFYSVLDVETEKDSVKLDYLQNVDASTEDQFEMVIENIVTEKEIQNYLHQCWRYNYVQEPIESTEEESVNIDLSSILNMYNLVDTPVNAVQAPWCLVCGGGDQLWECTNNCPASFHLACRTEWLVNIIHRKTPPKNVQKPTTLVARILSSTRIITSVDEETDPEKVELCPSCMWGPEFGYDDVVWHKLGACSWWPARVLTPGAVPLCLDVREHSTDQWPLKYYGTLNHSWGDSSKICLFLPKHTGALRSENETLRRAVLDACDDYVAVYLT